MHLNAGSKKRKLRCDRYGTNGLNYRHKKSVYSVNMLRVFTGKFPKTLHAIHSEEVQKVPHIQ